MKYKTKRRIALFTLVLAGCTLPIFQDDISAAYTNNKEFACVGSEPYWTLIFNRGGEGRVVWSEPDILSTETLPEPFVEEYDRVATWPSSDPATIPVSLSNGLKATITKVPDNCSDGMFGDQFPYAIKITNRGASSIDSPLSSSVPEFNGCCYVAEIGGEYVGL